MSVASCLRMTNEAAKRLFARRSGRPRVVMPEALVTDSRAPGEESPEPKFAIRFSREPIRGVGGWNGQGSGGHSYVAFGRGTAFASGAV